MNILKTIMKKGHSCKCYLPEDPFVGQKYICMCGANFTFVRTYFLLFDLWKKEE